MGKDEPLELKGYVTLGSLRGKIRHLFQCRISSTADFAAELSSFLRDLTNARGVAIFSDRGPEPLTVVGIVDPIGHLLSVAEAAASTDSVVSDGGSALAAAITLPDGGAAIVALQMPPGNLAQLSLAHERLELIHQICLSSAMPGRQGLAAGLLEMAAAVGKGDWSRAQDLSDMISAASSGTAVALAELSNGRIKRFVVSGQAQPSLRGGVRGQLQERIDNAVASAEAAHGVYLDGAASPRFAVLLHGEIERSEAARAVTEVMTGLTREQRSWAARNRWYLARAAIAVGLAALLFWPVDDAVNLPASIVAESERIVTAPFDGRIAEITVEDGQRVIAGDSLLIRMDTTQIDLDLAEARAALASALTRKDSLRSRNNAAELREAELVVEQVRLETGSLEEKRRLSAIFAPIDGVVRAEELSKRLGSFVGLGMPVLTIYGETGVMVDVAIDPRSRGRMTEASAGQFRPDAAPSRKYPLALAVISPAPNFEGESVTYLGRSTTVEAEQDGFLRPGMQGVAHFVFDEVPLWLLIWRRVRDRFLIVFWL